MVTVKKIFGVVKTVLVWLVLALAVFMMIFTLISVNTFDQNDRSIFGYKFFVVQTDSMSATDFDAGDVAISKTVDPSTLKEGDIITFISQNSESYGETITHKIRKLTKDANGDPGFVTYGTTTDTDDETIVTYPFVVGQYQGKIPNLGSFFMFFKTTPGYIICILIPFLLLIISQGVNCIRLFRRYRAEQMEEMQAEREKLEQERTEAQKMMEELMALKQQLAERENTPQPTPEPTAPSSAADSTAPTEQTAEQEEQPTEEQPSEQQTEKPTAEG